MTLNPEAVPTTWTTADETFFRVAFDVFCPAFLAGASALLASYDDEQVAFASPTIEVPVTTTSVEASAPTVG